MGFFFSFFFFSFFFFPFSSFLSPHPPKSQSDVSLAESAIFSPAPSTPRHGRAWVIRRGEGSRSPVAPGTQAVAAAGEGAGVPAAGGDALPQPGASAPRRAAAQSGRSGRGPGGGSGAGRKRRGDAVSRRGRRWVPLGCAHSAQPGLYHRVWGSSLPAGSLWPAEIGVLIVIPVLIISHRLPRARPALPVPQQLVQGSRRGSAPPRPPSPSRRQGRVPCVQEELPLSAMP